MKSKIIVASFIFVVSFIFSGTPPQIDWKKGKIFSIVTTSVPLNYKYADNRLSMIESAKEKAKVNYYRILQKININHESANLLEYIESSPDINRRLYSLFEKASLYTMQYPDLNTIRLIYFINLYGKNDSIMSLIMDEEDHYTEDLKQYMGYNYQTDYTGLVIDARGVLKSFSGRDVKIKPSIFVTVRDSDGNVVFSRYNILPDVIRESGMVRYSNNVNEDITDRVGKNPFRIVAYGAGDYSGSTIVISTADAKKLLSSSNTRDSVKNGKIGIIIDNQD